MNNVENTLLKVFPIWIEGAQRDVAESKYFLLLSTGVLLFLLTTAKVDLNLSEKLENSEIAAVILFSLSVFSAGFMYTRYLVVERGLRVLFTRAIMSTDINNPYEDKDIRQSDRMAFMASRFSVFTFYVGLMAILSAVVLPYE